MGSRGVRVLSGMWRLRNLEGLKCKGVRNEGCVEYEGLRGVRS